MAKYLSAVTKASLIPGGKAPEMEELFFQGYLGSGKTPIHVGADQARNIMNAVQSGKFGPDSPLVKELIAQGAAPGAKGGMIGTAVRGARAAGGLQVESVGLEAERVGAGGGFGKLMADMQRTGIKSVQVMQHFTGALDQVVGKVLGMLTSMDQLLTKLNIGKSAWDLPKGKAKQPH
jgi:hypothetical protein